MKPRRCSRQRRAAASSLPTVAAEQVAVPLSTANLRLPKIVRLPPLLAETNASAIVTWFVLLIYVAAGPGRVEFYYYHNKMALFTNTKKTQHKIFSNSLFYLNTVLTQSFEHYSLGLYTFNINLQIVR